MKQHYFISGLPRSGSTLLASILLQNPKIFADITSPVNNIIEQQIYIDTVGFNNLLTIDKKRKLLQNTFEIMYEDISKDIIFDTNRCWSGKLEIIHDIYPKTKVICCVRDIKSILNSFEHIYRQNLYHNCINVYGSNSNIYSRSQSLLSLDGMLGIGLNNLKQGIHSAYSDMLYIVEYDDLIEDTPAVLDSIYELLGFEPFKHNFNNLKNIENSDIVDKQLSLFNLHMVRPTIERQIIPNYIPHDLAASLENLEYWRYIY